MLIDALRTARTAGSCVRVIYNAGSQPGSQRDIVPLVVADEEIRAIDVATGIDKTFKIEFLAIAPVPCDAPVYDPALGKTESQIDSLSIKQVSETIADELRALGWHIVMNQDDISLFSHFKNGKPKKTPDVHLSFDQYTVELTIDFDGEMREERRLSNRPYRLESKAFASARTFGKLSAAWPKFIDAATSRAPKSQT